MQKLIKRLRPSVVVIDPITNFSGSGKGIYGVKSMLTHLVDFLKIEQITSMFTSLTFGGTHQERTAGVSSLMDTWIVLSDSERNGQRRRGLYVLKSRGMAHSRELRELVICGRGIELGNMPTGN